MSDNNELNLNITKYIINESNRSTKVRGLITKDKNQRSK